jgi:hypothetical protein
MSIFDALNTQGAQGFSSNNITFGVDDLSQYGGGISNNLGMSAYTINPTTGLMGNGMSSGMQASGGLFDSIGGLGGISTGVDILSKLGGMYLGYQANKQARKQMKWQRGVYERELDNKIKDYNTSLEDRIRARYATEARSAEEAEQRISDRRLDR